MTPRQECRAKLLHSTSSFPAYSIPFGTKSSSNHLFTPTAVLSFPTIIYPIHLVPPSLNQASGRHPNLFILHLIPLRTPTSSLPPNSSTPFRPILFLRRRRSHESEINANCLIEQFGAIGAGDGGAGRGLSWVFEEDVTLIIFSPSAELRLYSAQLHHPSARLEHKQNRKIAAESKDGVNSIGRRRKKKKKGDTNLHIPCPPIKIHMQILDLAILAKQLL